MTYLGMIEDMINKMIKQYAYYLAQNLKSLEENDPTIVTLNNILMVAPKTEPIKYDPTIVDQMKVDEDLVGLDDENPIDFTGF